MSLGKLVSILALVALVIPVTGCSGGGSSGEANNALTSAVQDIGVDPDGTTTVLTFESADGLAAAGITNFESDGGQTATSVAVNANAATVQWNGRVTSADQVRATGLDGVSGAYRAVTASSTAVPTFAIANGTQTLPLGGDSFEVVFSGPRVVASDVEDITNWTLTVNSTDVDLTGSTIAFTTSTQTAVITLGSLASLHATFELTPGGIRAVTDIVVANTAVAGTASGDSNAPTLLGATQNLTEDEFGRVIDFQFSEAMDPVTSETLSHFGVTTPDIAVSVERPSDDTLRVTFNNPIVPGVNTVALSTLIDAHGNAFTDDPAVPVAQGAPVVNAYSTLTANTVANSGGDTITVETSQAFDPDTAEDPTAWTLVVNAVTIDLTAQTLTYDLASKTLTFALRFDMQNGQAFTVTGVSVTDVDGDAFTLASGGTASGDATAPTLTSIIQNRNIDVTGQTLIVQFSEDVDETTAETTTNWIVSGTQNLTTATLLLGGDSVRLEYDALIVPGDVTFGALNVTDLAGNPMTTVNGVPITSSDTTAPSPLTVLGTAVEGAFDDTVSVVFDDDMIESEIENPANWTVESPIGTNLATTGDPVAYDSPSKTAVLTLFTVGNLARGSTVRAAFANCRDISGNTVAATGVNGTISAETTLPSVRAVYRDSVSFDQAVVVFSEPVLNANDAYDVVTNPDGARYILRDSGGAVRGVPTAFTPSADLLSVRLAFGFVVDPTDTLDVIGIVDMCGNPLFPELALATVAEATSQPGFGSLTAATISGENNDVILIAFDRPMNSFKLLEHANYSVVGPVAVDLSLAVLRFDGDDTVTIGLNHEAGHNLETGASYTVTVDDVWSAQGVQLSSAVVSPGNIAVGDVASATIGVSDVRIDPSTVNGLLVTASEALDEVTAENPAFYDYDGGNIATTASRVGSRTIRLTFGVTPVVGLNLQFAVTDLAGNASGSVTRAVAAADVSAPLVASVSGLAVPNLGRDTVSITFNEQVDLNTALVPANYTITNGTRTLNPALAEVSYASATNTLVLTFPGGSELDSNAGVTLTVQNVADFGGNVMPSLVSLSGPVAGDVTAPLFENAFVDVRVDASGRTIDVLFNEDVDTVWASNASHWSVTGGPTVTSVTMMEANRARLVLTGALGASATVTVTNLPDPANNLLPSLTIDPFE